MYKGPMVMDKRVGIDGGSRGVGQQGGIGTTTIEQKFLKKKIRRILKGPSYFLAVLVLLDELLTLEKAICKIPQKLETP